MRRLVDGVGEQTALIEADVSRRRADEARNRVTFHVLAHVETQELDSHHFRELPRDLGLADAGRSREEKRTDWFIRMRESRPCEFDRARDRLQRGILPIDDLLQLIFEILQPLAIGGRDRALRNLRHPGDSAFDVAQSDGLRLLSALARRCAATPASSTTSIALSGRNRSLM